MIRQRNISLLSNRLAGAGGRRIPEAVLERDYCLAWFLMGLSRSPLRDRLALKGGTALKRCYFGDYRFSENLDFTMVAATPFETTREDLNPLFDEVRTASGVIFRYARDDRHGHENSHTFYLGYEGPLPPAAGQEIKVDITIRERIMFPLRDRPVLRAYPEYADLPDGALVRAYSLEELAIEKIVAVTDPARSEPRDLYDLWFLLESGHIDLTQLRGGLQGKLTFRGRVVSRLREEYSAKERRLRSLWAKRLSAQMAALPAFNRVFRAVQRRLRQAGLTGR